MPAAATTPLAATLRERVKQWALRRQGRDVLPLRLKSRRIYILPTSAGWTFALLLVVMFLAGMNYGNGLALLFTFWLAGFALVAMVQTQRMLSGVIVHEARAEPAHAGGQVRLTLVVSPGRCAPEDLLLGDRGEAVCGLPAGPADASPARALLLLDLPAPHRGRWRAPALRLASQAPFGLFETWTWLAPEVTTLVYPAPAGSRPVPERLGNEAGQVRHSQGLDELAWLRDFREGDSPRQVAWKAYARGLPLLVREYQGESAHHHEFDFDALAGLDVESRLSQLTRWILDAAARGEGWVLRLPGRPALAGRGAGHRERCLAQLALYGLAPP
ncbi:MAG: DUF58 domain-containing protein [Pseudomonadota bacterium]|jgi:uncharacterized protein (DUF58 family)|nr:MAG: DUF58 domain-containing protein [Pseudomonadota bacterium]